MKNAIGNYPVSELQTIPDEFAGIANFTFGDCGDVYPERTGKLAFEFYKSNNAAWTAFVSACRSTGRKKDLNLFRNTTKYLEPKLAGIKAVYWAYSNFAKGTWKHQEDLDFDSAREFCKETFKLGTLCARINAVRAAKDFEDFWPSSKGKNAWFAEEDKASAVNHLWTINRSGRYKNLLKYKRALIRGFADPKFVELKVDPKRKKEREEEKRKAEEELSKAQRKRKKARFQAIQARQHRSVRPTAFGTTPKELQKSLKRAVKEEKKKGGSARRSKPTLGVERKELKDLATIPYLEYPEEDSRLVIFRFDGGYYLFDKITEQSGVFFYKDHERLVQMLKSRAKLIMYYSRYDISDPELCHKMTQAFLSLEQLFLDNPCFDHPDDANRVCRAFDVAQFVYLATLADDMWDRAEQVQWAKVKDEGLDKIVDIGKVIKIVDQDCFGVKESLELLKFYKLFPCPDFCTHSTMTEFRKKYENPNPATFTVEMTGTGGEDVSTSKEEFKKYCMRNRLINYYDVHGSLPGIVEVGEGTPEHLAAYPNIDPGTLTVDDMDHIDFKGSFVYRRYDGCEADLVKDKVTAERFSSRDRKEEAINKNQVLQYLFDPNFLSQSEVNKAFEEERWDKLGSQKINLAFKPEAKKPNSRLFGMAKDPDRRQLSELEANIARYARQARGSSQGKSDMDLDKKLVELSTVELHEDFEFITSFDLAAFTPKLNPEFKELQYETWEYCFGEPDIMKTMKIFTENSVRLNKFDVDVEWQLQGNDIEGFNARMNTLGHIDVMGYSIYKLKQLNVVKKQADLEVLIDDGLLKLKVPHEDSEMRWQMCLDVIEAVYEACGLVISWDKTFVSQVMCQYLNRVFYDGVEITPGAKAFLRIGKLQEVAVPTLADELATHGASARGSIQSGSDHRLAYIAYLWECYLTMLRWSGHKTELFLSKDLALRAFFPIGLTGFGFMTPFGLSTNESYDSMVAGVGNMKMIAMVYPDTVKQINSILQSGVRDMDGSAILRAPTALRSKYRCLNLRRFENAARAHVIKSTVNPLVREVATLLQSLDYDASTAAIENSRIIHEIKRDRLWKISPKSFMEKVIGKLQNGKTAAAMLGGKKCAVIYLVNRSEARVLIREASKGIFAVRI